jgi:hypothetical protein
MTSRRVFSLKLQATAIAVLLADLLVLHYAGWPT